MSPTKQIIFQNFNDTFKLDFNVFYLSDMEVIEDKTFNLIKFTILDEAKICLKFDSHFELLIRIQPVLHKIGFFSSRVKLDAAKVHKIEMLW